MREALVATSEKLGGMTVNERLYVLGLFDDYDEAIRNRDEAALRGVLRQTEIGESNIDAVVRSKFG